MWQSAGAPVAADRFGEVARVDQVVGTNLMQVRVKRADPELAARSPTADGPGDRRQPPDDQQEVVEARDYIKSQLDEASKRVEDVQARFVDIQQRSQVDALKRDAEVAIDCAASCWNGKPTLRVACLPGPIGNGSGGQPAPGDDAAVDRSLFPAHGWRGSGRRARRCSASARRRTGQRGVFVAGEAGCGEPRHARRYGRPAQAAGRRQAPRSGYPPDPGQALRGRRRGRAPEGRVRDGPEGVSDLAVATRTRASKSAGAARRFSSWTPL